MTIVHLLGFDVGFSEKKRSSGIAKLAAEELTVGRATAEWKTRAPLVNTSSLYDVVAIDAPLVAEEFETERACEKLFIGGAFQRRCKPGLSHVQGTGRRLRDAGRATAAQVRPYTSGSDLRVPFPRIWRAANVVEAFPNAYLGVLLPDVEFCNAPRLKRGRKFDWLYERCVGTGVFQRLVDGLGMTSPKQFVARLQDTRNHDERAALICLLTAAGVQAGRYTAIGDPTAGYFFLPEWSSWEQWAREGVESSPLLRSMQLWVNGNRRLD